MKKLSVLAFLFTLIFAVQMLPVRHITQWCNDTFAEETTGSCADDNALSDTGVSLGFFHNHKSCMQVAHLEDGLLRYIHFSTIIPANHSGDIVCPPPDATM